ncbi:hypothetical protein JHK85_023069 [Glycine max]|nr:hypothetical protein JHK85_023069 [Glycine max]
MVDDATKFMQKLYQITNGTALATTTYQATGSAHGSAGFVNIIDLHEKKVKFDIENNVGTLSSTFVKSVEEILYNISVSADALSSQPNMLNTFNDNLDGGLTIFFPLDNAFKAFLPKFENLTKSSKNDFTVQNDNEDVTLKMKLTTLKITDTLIDKQPPVML